MRSPEFIKSNKINIFCYLDNTLGRDTEIVLPVCYALERYHNCNITYFFIWDIFEIRKHIPDMVMVPNVRGHHMYVEIAEYAHNNNIKVLALESEGNFRTDGTFDFWGYNYKKLVYQEWLTCWSDRTRNYLNEIIPLEKDKNKVVTTGGTGFDKYEVLVNNNREDLLKKYGKGHFKKVIGYAGWGFGKIYGSHKSTFLEHVYPGDFEKRFDWIEERRLFVRNILKRAIEENPDILFILKRHPKESFESDVVEGKNEMNELTDYSNVIYIRKEEPVNDLINISDIWMGFQTTTAVEAWLLKKPTILINDGHKYSKDNLYDGSVTVTNSEQLINYIKEYYQESTISLFADSIKTEARKKIIEDTIGFADGKNHMRAVEYFKRSLSKRKCQRKPNFSLRHFRLYSLMHLGKYLYRKNLFSVLPYFRKTIYVFENYGLAGLNDFKNKYYRSLDKFHDNSNLT